MAEEAIALTMMDRAACVRLVEDQYFGAMMRRDLPGILGLFAPDALITTFHGEAAARRIRSAPARGEEPLSPFFSDAMANFDVKYSDFVHVVDLEAQRIVSRYTLHVSARPKGGAKGMTPRRWRNCNCFVLEDGKIARVTIYFANPPTLPERD